jgi:hypothetical protein
VDRLKFHPNWRLIDLWNDAYLVGNHLLGIDASKLDPADQPSWELALLVLGAVCASCVTYLILRIRAVEIVR